MQGQEHREAASACDKGARGRDTEMAWLCAGHQGVMTRRQAGFELNGKPQ
jgi:hypothetical protein